MDELQSSGANSTAADQVEIFDNGVHLGFANVANGQWSLTGAPLPVGEHALTAKYKGVTTTAPWRMTVDEAEHFDDFESVALGAFSSIQRPHYRGITRFGGTPPGRDSSLTSIVDQGNWTGAGKHLKIFSYMGYSQGFTTTYTMTFNELYTTVRFEARSTFSGGAPSVSISALAEDGTPVASLDSEGGEVVFRAPDGKFIKSLVFFVSANSSGSSASVHLRSTIYV